MVTVSEAMVESKAAVCLVAACGLAAFPLPKPDAVHPNMVLVA